MNARIAAANRGSDRESVVSSCSPIRCRIEAQELPLTDFFTFLLGIVFGSLARYIVDGVFELKLSGVLCVMVIAWSLIIWLARRSR